MKPVVLICVLFLGYGVLPVEAGRVVAISDSPEIIGKLTLTPTTIRVETISVPAEINLSDVLEADFGETPFQLDCFFGSNYGGNQLPTTWKAQDIGMVDSPGSVVNADGTLTLSGGGDSSKRNGPRISDALFFAGQPWTGDGQLTARVKEIDAQTPEMAAGLMLRDTLDANSVRFSLEAMTQGNGGFAIRAEAGRPVQRMPVPMDLPIWLRLTRYGAGVFAATSSDGKVWDLVGQNMLWQNNPNLPASSWIGLFASSRKGLGKVVVDQVSFTPTPSAAQVLPPGALLRSGSFLAGAFEYMGFDPANPDAYGRFNRSGKFVAIPRSKIAAVTMLPTARNQIAEMGSHIGLLMKNGDVMDGDFDSIGGNGVRITSVLLGMTAYNRSEVRACFLHPAQAQPATYEIRLRDGSIVKASGISSNNGVINIEEVSGVSVPISPDEIVQFRAGSSRVQSLDELDWKATQPPVAPVANTAPLTNTAPAVNGVPDQLPSVRCWEGKNQEQIMEAPVGTTLDFPLPGRFRVMCARIAVSPDSPPNSQVTLRILADGKEIGRTPPLRAGEQPRLMKVTIQDPKTVTIESDSIFVDSKVLLIDPVAVRDN